MTAEAVWMTVSARQRLEEELAGLERVTHRSDSPEASRMLHLRSMLRNSEVDTKPDDGLVEPGMRITVRFERDQSTSSFLLGSREITELDPDLDIDVYSPTSPLGTAISGTHVGDVVTFTAPSGPQEITILAAVPFG